MHNNAGIHRRRDLYAGETSGCAENCAEREPFDASKSFGRVEMIGKGIRDHLSQLEMEHYHAAGEARRERERADKAEQFIRDRSVRWWDQGKTLLLLPWALIEELPRGYMLMSPLGNARTVRDVLKMDREERLGVAAWGISFGYDPKECQPGPQQAGI